ncbi:beta-lactamase family protein [Amycolatopsis sp. NBC_00345]|uniref:serine hydrolase domain-containing protein n=1 Tax=Amycolatopsis sp. NBC_00345 TaxID=2975955 RepID=UPI002E25F66E
MRGWTSAVVALAVTASVGVVPVASAAPSACDTKPIQTALAALKNIGAPGVAVTVKSPNCGVWNGGVGLADRRTGRNVVGDEHSRIASDTKTWTAAVVLQLVGEGKIDLDETVDHYLPGVVRTPVYDGRKITVRQLLQQTSGLPDYLDAPFWNDEEAHRWEHIDPSLTVRQALALDPPEQAPSGFAYANTNYNLAGMIVTKVTGRPVGTELTQRIIKPLGLCETYWPGDETTIDQPELRGYPEQEDGTLADKTEWNTSEADASGELISTGADATAFWTALLTGKVLAPAQLAEMKRTVPDDYGEGYGLGLQQYQLTPGLFTWGHSGGMSSGHEFRNAVTDDGRRAVTLLIDTDKYDSDAVDSIIGALIRDLR